MSPNDTAIIVVLEFVVLLAPLTVKTESCARSLIDGLHGSTI